MARWLNRGGWLSVGLLSVCLAFKPAVSADVIYFTVGPLLQSLSVSSLTAFAKEGAITGDMARYAPFIGEERLRSVKTLLTKPYPIDSLTVGDLAYTPLGAQFLERLGEIFQTETGGNGFYALRSSLIATTQRPEGFTALGFLQDFPTNMRIDTQAAMVFMQDLTAFLESRNRSLAIVAAEADQEKAAVPEMNLSQMPDLNPTGPTSFSRQQLAISRASGSGNRQFLADLYIPNISTASVPVVLISPNPGSGPNDVGPIAETLASHGFLVAVLNHPGNETATRVNPLENRLSYNLTASEFLDRPKDITAALDSLAGWSQANPQVSLNLEQVGVVGDYLGGYTALAAAGAQMNPGQLAATCSPNGYVLNLSVFFQCRASDVANRRESLRDDRVAAIAAINPFGSALFGSTGIGQIKIPVMLIASSNDLLTPALQEQIEPFTWLTMADRFLALKSPSKQEAASENQGEPLLLTSALSTTDTRLSTQYDRALTLAFMQTYIAKKAEYAPYLSAAYAASISQEPLTLHLIRQLTQSQLQSALGKGSPVGALPALAID